MIQYFVGCDLGQAADYTALAVVEKMKPAERGALSSYQCRHLERLPLGTLYPDVVSRVRDLLAASELEDNSALCVDATGVGRPVVDMLRAAGLTLDAVTITGGDSPSFENGMHRVPKRDLVSVLQVLLQNERLQFAATMPEAPKLIQEMLAFQVKISDKAHDSYGAWREGAHDDLVLAVALAVWKAERQRESRVPISTSGAY
jgi:hypothetical protein